MTGIVKSEFAKLSQPEKLRMLYEHGTFILNVRYYGYKINLYLLKNFYVEVFYNHKEAKIEKVEPMTPSKSRSKFYSDQIQLPKNLI